jgi:hypothetical protein
MNRRLSRERNILVFRYERALLPESSPAEYLPNVGKTGPCIQSKGAEEVDLVCEFTNEFVCENV